MLVGDGGDMYEVVGWDIHSTGKKKTNSTNPVKSYGMNE